MHAYKNACRVVIALLITVQVGLAQQGYKKPPKEVLDILNAPTTPSASLSPTREHLLLLTSRPNPPLADLAQLAKWLAPLLAPDGRIVALKGRLETAREECTALGDGWRSRINPVNLPGEEAERCIVVLEREVTGQS